MPRAPRRMRLSAEHVRRVHRDIADPGLQLLPGYRAVSDEDDTAEIARMSLEPTLEVAAARQGACGKIGLVRV